MEDATIEKIREAVRDEVRITVNGKIDKIKEHLEKQDEKLASMEVKIDELKPLSEAQKTIKNLRTFFMWVAAPISIIWGLIKWIK